VAHKRLHCTHIFAVAPQGSTPADAALMMQLGAKAIFVGSGIFMKERATPLDVENNAKEREEAVSRAKAMVIATTHYPDPVWSCSLARIRWELCCFFLGYCLIRVGWLVLSGARRGIDPLLFFSRVRPPDGHLHRGREKPRFCNYLTISPLLSMSHPPARD
jgi:hypothetical protein